MARRLIDAGHSVTMVCGSYGMGKTGLEAEFENGRRRGMVDDIDVLELHLPYDNRTSFFRRSLLFLRFAASSVRVSMVEPCDVVVATSTPLTAAIPGIFARLFRRKPFVFEVRDLWPELPRAMGVITNPVVLALMSVLEWLAYRIATSCVGLSPGIVRGIESRAPEKQRVALIPNGCDLDFFTRNGEKTPIPGRDHPDDLVAVFTGAHGLANGLDAVVEAAAELQRRSRSDIKLVLIGDGMEKSRLRKLCDERRLANVFFMDPVPKTQLRKLLRDADVGLMILANVPAFYYGTSPNKFFDYIALGLPVLNNYPGWLADMISATEIGIAVPPEDTGAFADALEQLANCPRTRREMGHRARRLAEKEFSRDDLADKFVAELERAAR